MRHTRLITLAAAIALVLPSASQAQYREMRFGGQVMSRSMPGSVDFAQLSQPHIFGTARVMGMGGAFTSLGADLSSMSINPAGMGMYRRNEISLTPLLSVAHSQTEGTQPWQGDNKTRFAFANVGMALNVFESSSSPLTSLTFGFGVNRIADFNTRYSFSSESLYNPSDPDRIMPTIADVFGQQLGQQGIFPSKANDGSLNGSLGYNGFDPSFWPAILGYNGYLINAQYADPSNPDDRDLMWVPDLIGHNASVLQGMDVVNSGSINEFAFSMGANINNVVYIGATIGIQSVYKKSGVTYQEEYGYFDANGRETAAVYGNGDPLETQLDYMNLYQMSEISGGGMNFKLGVIVRPVAGLRLGVAFHTPTYYWLNYTYWGDIESRIYNNRTDKTQDNTDGTPAQKDEGPNTWEMASPTRLLLGASYTFGNFAIVSVDYERDWYNGIRVKNLPEGAWSNGVSLSPEYYKSEYKNYFQGTNSIRAGVEIRPLPTLALRLGGGYTGSMFKDRSLFYDTPATYETYYFSAGVGFNLSRNTVLDLAYQNVTNKQTPYELFYSQYMDNGDMHTYSGLYDTKQTRHYIALTLGFRF